MPLDMEFYSKSNCYSSKLMKTAKVKPLLSLSVSVRNLVKEFCKEFGFKHSVF